MQVIPQIFEAFLYLMARSAEGLKFGKGNGPEENFIRRGVFRTVPLLIPLPREKLTRAFKRYACGGPQIRLWGSFKFICLKSRNFFAYFHTYLDFCPTLENFNHGSHFSDSFLR